MVDTNATGFFPLLQVSQSAATQFADAAGKDRLIVPLLERALLQNQGTDLTSQPTGAEVRTELGALIDRLVAGGADSRTIAKASCAAALGSGALTIL
jgi:hypothetical protein